MLEKDIKTVKEIIELERESGHTLFDLDSYESDLLLMAEDLDVETIETEDGDTVFKNENDRKRVEEAYNFYLECRA